MKEFFFSDLKDNLFLRNFTRIKPKDISPLRLQFFKNKYTKQLQLSLFEDYLFKKIQFNIFSFKIISKNQFFIEINKRFNFRKLRLITKLLRKIFQRYNLGFFSTIEIKGLGFKYFLIGHNFYAEMGKSHSFVVTISKRIFIFEKKERILFFAQDSNLLNNTLLTIRSIRIPDSYKGKGILFNQEIVKLKPGKKKS